MKNGFLILFLPVICLCVSGCETFKTPEELILPPETNIENKQMNAVVRDSLPINSELLTIPAERSGQNTESVLRLNMDEDDEDELVALFREKTDREIGLMILDGINGSWLKKLDIKLDSYEVIDYAVKDLDNNGTDELLIGYVDISTLTKKLIVIGNKNQTIKTIFQTDYLALDMNRVNKNNEVLIALSTRGNSIFSNRFVVLVYRNHAIQKIGELVYPEDVEVYRILYGKVNLLQNAYFLDMYVNEGGGRTDIVDFSGQDLVSLIRKGNLRDVLQKMPMASMDINADGIVEIVENKVLEETLGEILLTESYWYSLNINNELVLLNRSFEDFQNGIKMIFPPTDTEIKVKKINGGLRIYYRSASLGRDIQLVEIIKTDFLSIEKYGTEYVQVARRNSDIIVAKLSTASELTGVEKYEFDRLYNSIRDLSEVVKFII